MKEERIAKLRILCDCGCRTLMGPGTKYILHKANGWHGFYAIGHIK